MFSVFDGPQTKKVTKLIAQQVTQNNLSTSQSNTTLFLPTFFAGFDINRSCEKTSNGKGQTAIWLATKNNDVEKAKELIAKVPKLNLECYGEDDDGRLRTPLLLAAKHNHSEIFNLLMRKGADPNASDKTMPRPTNQKN